MERDTGARGLRSIIEQVMLDVLYDLPELETKGKFVVTEEVVKGLKPLFEQLPESAKLSA